MDNRFGMSLLLLSFLPLVLSSSQNNHTTASYQISRKPCQVKGKEGTCMFVWECVKSEGTPLGMCMERFMFGSCCSHDVDNDVVPKQSTTASSISATVSTSTESWLTVPTLTAIITSRPPTLSSTTTVVPVTFDPTYGSNKEELPTVDYNASTTSSTTSPTHNTMTSSTTSRIPSAGSPATLGPIKLRPKPYRRTTTRRAAIPTTTTNYPASSTEALNGTASALIAPPLTDAPNLLMSDSIVALTVPITTESNSATLTSPFDITNTLTYFNELNTTDEMPDTIPTATNQPFYDVTTGVTSMMEDVSTITETTESSTEQMTTVTSTVTTSLTTSESAVHNVTTTIQPSLKPILIVTLTNNKTNSTSSNPETTKKPVMAVTSLPSSYPNVECGVPPLLNRHQEGRIVGGSNSKFGSWPWQVSVRRTSFFGFSSTHRCGGALLNELWVITAGHCVEDLLVSQIRLRMGEFDFSSVQEPYPFVERGVNKKIVHPKYNFFTYEYDLALVRLEEPITFQPNIAPICLPAMDESLIGQNGTVTGWGRLSEGGTLPSMLQQVTVPIVSNDKCKDMFLKAGRHEYIPDIFMCAGFEEGGRDSCQGDSGGPLQIRGRDGRYFLAGIISWGIGCAEANLPGVCTRISKFTSWILENVT